MNPNDDFSPFPWEGLTSVEVALRLKRYGPNRLKAGGRFERLKEFLKTLADPMAVMLLCASAIYFFLGDKRNAVILLGAVLPVLAVDVVLEFRSRQALKKLAEAVSPLARVIRDGVEKEISTASLVPGDLLLLKEGDGIPADGAILQCANFQVDESQLTGEAEPVSKKNALPGKEDEAGEFSRFFAGSTVLAGQASGVILETGSSTRFGQIAGLVAEGGEEATPLQKKTASIVKQLAVIAAAVILWVFITGLWRGASWPSALLPAISLGIAVIPEEFPLVLTVFLSLGAWRLAKKGILVKHLASVETLGATTVICVDKTGTLTQGSFQLASHLPLSPHASEEAVLEASVLACELSPADPMEKAILAHTREHGVQVQKVQDRWELVYDYDFDPVGKHMSHVWRKRENPKAWRIVAKGALEGILEHCGISDQERNFAERENERLAAHGSRVLAVAGKDADGFTGRRADDEQGLKLFGLLAFQDPLRPDAPLAVEHCQEAGIRVKIITGDHLLTAHAVADAVGIHHRPEDLLNATGLARLSPVDFAKKVADGVVFARVQPEQKYAIVEALKRNGEVVAMTGDGINDAPALKKADIGVAMGVRGT
ncbi:MAG TPA: cation-transporting P-type ATPase, partial [bacterium]|nr:cation-transporting P-type ATPase [bacterium]